MTAKVVLDANVLYSARLRDLLMELAVSQILELVWTKRIEDEWIKAILRHRPDLSRQLRRTAAEMRLALPDARIDLIGRELDDYGLPDPDDAHVVAAAIASGTAVIVTFNDGDFPHRIVKPLGIETSSPDNALLACSKRDPEGVFAAIATVRARLRAPTISGNEYVSGLVRAGCPRFAAWVKVRVSSI